MKWRVPVATEAAGGSLNVRNRMTLVGGLAEETLDIPIPAGVWALEWYDAGLSGTIASSKVTIRVVRNGVMTVLNVGEIAAGHMFNALRGSADLTLEGGDVITAVIRYATAGQSLEFEIFLRRVLI